MMLQNTLELQGALDMNPSVPQIVQGKTGGILQVDVGALCVGLPRSDKLGGRLRSLQAPRVLESAILPEQAGLTSFQAQMVDPRKCSTQELSQVVVHNAFLRLRTV